MLSKYLQAPSQIIPHKRLNIATHCETIQPMNFAITTHLPKKAETGQVSLTPLDNLTGIQMMADVAETLVKNEYVEHDDSGKYNFTDEVGRLNVNKPLTPGDVVGTCRLPFIENGVVKQLCECSIVFDRFVSENNSAIGEEVRSVGAMSLEDIIDDEEDEEEDFGEYYTESKPPMRKRRKTGTTPKGGRIGRRMAVYQYREHEASNELQKELQKSIMPELLKDPAVVKYLETMTGKSFESFDAENLTDETETNIMEPVNDNDDAHAVVKKDHCINLEAAVVCFESDESPATVLAPGSGVSLEVNSSNRSEDTTITHAENNNEQNKEGKKNKIVVKWDQNSTKSDQSGVEKTRELSVGSKDVTETSHVKQRSLEGKDSVGDLEFSEGANDDEEQEMMDMGSDNSDSDTNKEQIMDSASENQLSLFSSKIDQFVIDIASEVKEKFSGENENKTSTELYGNNSKSADNNETISNNTLDKYSTENGGIHSNKNCIIDVSEDFKHTKSEHQVDKLADLQGKKFKFFCSICQKSLLSVDSLKKHLLTHGSRTKESRKGLRNMNRRLNILSMKDSDVLNEKQTMDALKSETPIKTEDAIERSTLPSDNLLFYCMICDIMLPSKQELHDHCKIHTKKAKNQTKRAREDNVKLDGTSASEDTLTADSELECCNESEEELFGDKELKKVVFSKTHLTRKKSYQTGNKSRLETANKRRSDKITETNRKKTIRNDYICETCGFGFTLLEECTEHMDNCKVQGMHKCFQGCGYIFKTWSELDYHKRFCSRRSAYLERIQKELDKNEKWERKVLDESGNHVISDKTSNDQGLQIITEEIGGEDDAVKCLHCDLEFLSQEKMTYHQLVCRNRPIQTCDHCDFKVKGDKAMGKHLVDMHGLKPFQCDSCPRMFKLKASLRDHVKYAHTKETFTCEYCGKSFRKQSLYRSHVSIQHQGFRYTCSYCSKKFKDRRTWLVHEKSHKGAYDYACPLCKTTYNRSETYRSHMKEVHSIEGQAALTLNTTAKELRDRLCLNVCCICNEKFPLESAFSLHMVKEHGQSGL